MRPPNPITASTPPVLSATSLVIGLALLVLARFLPVLKIGSISLVLGPMALWTGLICVFQGMAMILYAKAGKFRHRDRVLAQINWTGNEAVLDVGTGRGLLLIGAARKLTTGKAMGIDIWSKADLSGNSMEKTLSNVELEGVSSRVEIRSEDATAMKFPDGTFDVVLSNLCIHNIRSRQGRDQACGEIFRVLKPGGRAIISDFKNTADYVKAFQSAQASASRGSPDFLHTFPPLRVVEVTKK